MKKLVTALLFLLLTVTAAQAAELTDFRWQMAERNILLTEYIGSATEVTVPDTLSYQGADYPVTVDAATLFRGNRRIRSVTLSPELSFLDNSMARLFQNCTALQTVHAQGLDTASISTMRAMFSGCETLRAITGYEDWNTSSLESINYLFDRTYKLQTVDLSRWDLSGLKNSGWCFQYCGASTILLPDNLSIISAGFLNHASHYKGTSFTVPAGVNTVGYAHTLYDFGTDRLTEILVAEGNTAYRSVDGVLLSGDGTEFLAMPRGKAFPEGRYQIPEGVTFLGELSFSRNYQLKTLVLPDSLTLSYIPVKDSAYVTFEDIGNLNGGLNLNIAIYCYTGITAYEVKDSNPRYFSVDGVIYRKQDNALVAVPTRYDRPLEIPEGITKWESHAMWCAGDLVDSLMANCNAVSIPASMTDIAPDQLAKLNRLEADYGLTIRLAEGNPAYYLAGGQLVSRPRLEDCDLRLAESDFVYDGQPKTPAVTVLYDAVSLTEGADYTVSYENNLAAGTATVTLTGLGEYFGTAELSFTIRQAAPAYTVPEGLTAVSGQTTADIPLPKDFSFMEEMTFRGEGDRTLYLRYTSPDPNYHSAENIPVIVTVQPQPEKTAPSFWWLLALLPLLFKRKKK